MLKILHFADAHGNADILKFTQSMDEIISYLRKNHIDLIVFCDDLFDSVVDADEEYYYIINKFASLGEFAPVVCGYGTPSHDYKGSLDVLKTYNSKYPITLIDKGNFDKIFLYSYFEGEFKQLEQIDLEGFDESKVTTQPGWEYLISFHLPWPMRYNFLREEELMLSLPKQEEIFQYNLEKWCYERKLFTQKSTIPVIFSAHLQLEGSIPTFKQDLYTDTHKLKMFSGVGDVGLGGHIHKHQTLSHDNWKFHYAGSIFNKTWNEMENKYFNIVEIKNKSEISLTEIKFNTPLLVKVDIGNYEEYENFKSREFKDDIEKLSDNIKMWVRLDLPSKDILDMEVEKTYWKKYVKDIRIDINYIKDHSIQRSKIASDLTHESLGNKFTIWAKDAKDIVPNEFQIQKIKDLESL